MLKGNKSNVDEKWKKLWRGVKATLNGRKKMLKGSKKRVKGNNIKGWSEVKKMMWGSKTKVQGK